MAQFIDHVFIAIAIVLPPVLVFILKRHGVIWGAVAVWASLIAAGAVLQVMDPASRNAWTTFFDMLWIVLGWAVGLLYCLPFLLIKLGYRRLRARKSQVAGLDVIATGRGAATPDDDSGANAAKPGYNAHSGDSHDAA